jgi:hypothetical protein
VRQYHCELLASVPGNKVIGTQTLIDSSGYCLQALIA